MNRFLCQWIDRRAIHYAASRLPKPDGRDLHLDETQQLLQNLNLDFAAVPTASINFTGLSEFQFRSPRPSGHAVNDIVSGRLYRCGAQWQRQPAVLLLHGWNDALNHLYFFPRHARRLNQLGLNAATIQLPWQFDRRPRELGAWGNFLTADILHTVEAMQQALADIRAAVNWLFEQGCPFVGLWGVSLSGWLTGMTICHDARIGGAALIVPLARVDRMISEAEFCESVRSTIKNRALDIHKLNLAPKTPIIDKSRILLIKGEHDVFVAPETVEELWQAWGQPEIWRYPSGHISILYAKNLSERTVQWFAAKANEPAVK